MYLIRGVSYVSFIRFRIIRVKKKRRYIYSAVASIDAVTARATSGVPLPPIPHTQLLQLKCGPYGPYI